MILHAHYIMGKSQILIGMPDIGINNMQAALDLSVQMYGSTSM